MANKIYVWKGGQSKNSTQQVLANFNIDDFNFNKPGNWYRLSLNNGDYNVLHTQHIPTHQDTVVFGNIPALPGQQILGIHRKAAVAPCLFGGWSGDEHRGTFLGGLDSYSHSEAGTTTNGSTFTSAFTSVIVDSHGIKRIGFIPDIEPMTTASYIPHLKFYGYGYGVSLSTGFTWTSAGPLLGGGIGKNSYNAMLFIRDNFPAVFDAGITNDQNNPGGWTGSFFDGQNNLHNDLRLKSGKYEIYNLGFTASACIDIETVPNLSPFGNTYPSTGYTGPLTGLYTPVIKSKFTSDTTRFLKVKNGKFKEMNLNPSFYKDSGISSRWSEFILDTSIETLYSHDYLSSFRGVTLGHASFYSGFGVGFGQVGASGTNQYRQVTIKGNQNRLNILQEHYPGITVSDTSKGYINIVEGNGLHTDTYLLPNDEYEQTYELSLVCSDCFRDDAIAAHSYTQILAENSVYSRLALTIADHKYPKYYIGNLGTYDTDVRPISNIETLNLQSDTVHPVVVSVADVNINTTLVQDNCVLRATNVGDRVATTRIGSTTLSTFGSLDLTPAEGNPNHNIYFGIQGVTSVSGGISSIRDIVPNSGGIIRTNSEERLFNVSAKLANTYVGPNDEIIFINQIPPVTTTKK